MAALDGFKLPGRLFTVICQGCKATLGGFHVPCDGGIAVFICQSCGTVTACKNQKYGIQVELVAKTKPTCPSHSAP